MEAVVRKTKWLACCGLLIVGLGCGAKEDDQPGDVPAPPGTMMGGVAAPGVGGPAMPGTLPPPTSGSVPPPGSGSMAGAPSVDPGAGAAGGAAPPTMVPPGELPDATPDRIPENCQAYPLIGMKYSPGGDVPPNKCAKFHVTFNNQYAVRCIDAIAGYDTGFPGDEYCIIPPPPDKGLQIGFYPHGDVETYWNKMWAGDFSDYAKASGDWILPAGGEITENYRGHSKNTEEFKYYRTYFRMRTGSHHNIITMHMSDGGADRWLPGEELPGLFGASAGAIIGVLGGQQRPDDSTPVTMEKPPEDKGLYLRWPANPTLVFNLHHFNTTDKTVLREGWSNIWWEDDATQLVSWYMGLDFTQVIGLAVPPGQTQDLHYYWSVPSDVRLLRVFGHRHAWTSNFSSWIKRKDTGMNELIYQSYEWQDMPTFRYDSAVKNPPLAPDDRLDGATSGVLNLKTGDELHFNCHIEYHDKRAQAVNAPMMPGQQGTLRFANEAFKGEMCIQFGNVTGGGLGLPGASATAVPDFAKASSTAQ
jgi:hypothetical protein